VKGVRISTGCRSSGEKGRRRLGRKAGSSQEKGKADVPDKLPGEPEEGLLEVVVGLGRDLEVLQVLLSVEGDGSSLDLSLLQNAKAIDASNRHVSKLPCHL
jgi:hypothetical protein